MAELQTWHTFIQALTEEANALELVLQTLSLQQRSLIAQEPESIRACSQECETALKALEVCSQHRHQQVLNAGYSSVHDVLVACKNQAPEIYPQLEASVQHLLALLPQLQQAQYTNLALIQQGQALTENTLETLVYLQTQQNQPATYSEQGQQSSSLAPQSAAAIYDFNV